MRGTLRIVLGLIILFGVAGGVDIASDPQLVILGVFAAIGGALMYSGVKAIEDNS